MDQAVADARAKLKERFGNKQQIGGKGTQRRIKAPQSKPQVAENKKIKSAIKKFGKS